MIERHDASFGTRLRRLREAAGITQEELAERAGLSAKGINDLERGERRRPYPHTVCSLADALKLSGDERASLLASVPRRSATAPAPSKMALGSVLPIAPTSLVGREQDLGEVTDLLRRPEVRLITLTGVGGVGKTRLAQEVANEAGSEFPDGVARTPPRWRRSVGALRGCRSPWSSPLLGRDFLVPRSSSRTSTKP